jgi:Ca-activated chloride channel family protein
LLEFGNLWVFLLLILFFICYRFCPEKRVAIYFPHFSMTKKLNSDFWLKFFIFTSILFALSNPYIKKEIIQTNKGDAIVLSIDSSGSMSQFNKFEFVKIAANDFIKKRKTDKIGLVVFGSNSFIASPLTENKKFVREILNKMYVGIAGRQTAILDSLVQSIRLLKNSKAKTKIIILLTDGMDNSSKVNLSSVMKEIKKYNIKIYTIGVGGADEVNFNLLSFLAKNSGGAVFQALTPNDILPIYQKIDSLEKSNITHKLIYKEYLYIYPLILAIILLLVYIRRRV